MKYRTVTERIGEHLGPVDWDWPGFKYADPGDVETLRKLAADPSRYYATTDTGWPRFGFHEVLEVGMYDGWPYWKPHPSVLTNGVLGPEWHSFESITEIVERKNTEPSP